MYNLHENKNENSTSFTNKKIRTQQVPGTKSVSRRKKLIYEFQEEKIQLATSFANKWSENNKFNVQNQFNERKINAQ